MREAIGGDRRTWGLVAVALLGAPTVSGLAGAGYGRQVAVAALIGLIAWLAFHRGGFGLAVLGVGTSFVNGVQLPGTLNVPDVFLIPAAVVAVATLVARRWSLPTWFVVPAVGVAVTGSVAALVGLVPATTLFSLHRFVGVWLLTVLVVGVLGSTRRRLEVLALAFLVGSVLHAGLASLDALGVWHLASNITGSEGYENSGRVTGLTTHANLLGLASAMAVPFALHFANRHRAYYLMIAPLVLGVVASGSRAGMLAVAVGALAHIVVRRRRTLAGVARAGLVLAAAGLGAVQLGITVGIERVTGGDSTVARADAIRAQLADDAWTEFLAHPVVGVGFGPQEAHDLYLEVLRSGGLVTLVLFVAFAGGCIAAAVRLVPTESGGPSAAAVASFAAWLVAAAHHNALTDRFLYVPAGLIVAAWMIERYGRSGVTIPTQSRTPGPTPRHRSFASRPANAAPRTGPGRIPDSVPTR